MTFKYGGVGIGGSTAFSAVTGNATDNSSLSTALRQSIKTYTAPTPEALISTASLASQITCDSIDTVVTDGLTSMVNWAGNGFEAGVVMGDGTEFIRYANGSNQDVIKMSAVGGGTPYTTVSTDGGSLLYSILVRDPTTDTAIHMWASGSSMYWSLKARAYGKVAGVWQQLGSDYTLPYNGFLQGLSTNPYIRCGMGPNGDFVLVQPDTLWPGAEGARTQTRHLVKYILRGRFTRNGSTGTFSFDPMVRIPMEERQAYDVPFVGLNGDPDYVCGLANRDVRNDEDIDYVTQLNGTTTSFYDFDRIGFWWYNFRTKENGFKWLTAPQGFLNNTAIARVTYAATSTTVTVQEVVKGTLRNGQTITNVNPSTTGGITNGSTISSGAGGSSLTISAATGGTAVTFPNMVTISCVDPTPSTPCKRYSQAIKSNDGYIYLVYQNVRHVSTGGAAITVNYSTRILKLSALGEVIFDEPLMPEGSSPAEGAGQFGIIENAATNVKYVIRVQEGSAQTSYHFLRVYENPAEKTTTTGSTTNASTTVTIPAGDATAGAWLPGSWIKASNLPAGAQIVKWITYAPGSGGTIQLTHSATSTLSGTATLTARCVVGCEGRTNTNHINAMWGTSATYMGTADTRPGQPARASGGIPQTCDDRSGSAQYGNKWIMYQSRRINDHPSASSGGTNEKVERLVVRPPA